MEQGGYIVLVNRTLYVWTRKCVNSYQMNNWNFPEKINPGDTIKEYVKCNENFLKNKGDDGGDVTFAFEQSDMTLRVEARVINDRFDLKMFLSNITTVQHQNEFDLGWVHNGNAYFRLVQLDGKFSAAKYATQWMSSNLALLGGRSLMHICMPGSHDSGMSERGVHTLFGFDCNTITQTNDILHQLMYGARYFDIRPVISGGDFYTGHYGEIKKIGIDTWQGANGQSIDSVISQVNRFTGTNNELIILNISHDLNTDVGNMCYRPFNPDEWNRLFHMLEKINFLFKNSDPDVKLTTLPLNTYIGKGKAAVIVVVEPDCCKPDCCDLGEYAGRGFYKKRNFKVFNEYSNTNDLNTMTDGQIRKMEEKKSLPNDSYFLLSWTLTQSDLEAATCSTGKVDSILALANRANAACYWIMNSVTPQVYPNIFYIDNITDTRVLDIAMEINQQADTDSHSSLLKDKTDARAKGQDKDGLD